VRFEVNSAATQTSDDSVSPSSVPLTSASSGCGGPLEMHAVASPKL
jgi:hypothetical protein